MCKELDEIENGIEGVFYCEQCTGQDSHETCSVPNRYQLERWMRGVEKRLAELERSQ